MQKMFDVAEMRIHVIGGHSSVEYEPSAGSGCALEEKERKSRGGWKHDLLNREGIIGRGARSGFLGANGTSETMINSVNLCKTTLL